MPMVRPLEIAIESRAASASFSGRLATAKVLSLAGPLSITSPDPSVMARWAGIALSEGTKLPGPLNLDGSLDSAGRAYAIRNAALTLGQFRAAGDVVADLRGERPKLQANLEADTVWLDALLPLAGAEPGGWGRAVLPLPAPASIDAELSILSRAAAYGGLRSWRLAFRCDAQGREARGLRRLPPREWRNGELHRLDRLGGAAACGHPSASRRENAGLQALIGALTGVRALAGTGNLTLDLKAQGTTQEELVGTLQGTASLSLDGGPDRRNRRGRHHRRSARADSRGLERGAGRHAASALTASVTLADGLATLSASQAATPGLQLSLTGTVDLLRRAIDIKAGFLPPETAPLPVPVVVQGNWSAPRIYPDIPDILNNPEGGFARLRTAETPPGN